MTWTAQGGTATITNGETVVSTNAPFESNLIAVGSGFNFPGEVEYAIIDVNPAEGEFTIDAPYGGSSKTNLSFNVKPYPGAVRSAERALRAATEAIENLIVPDAMDATTGRLMRVGDFGFNGQTILLGAGADLNDVVQDGYYIWLGTSVPLNAPAPTGSHAMRVREPTGVSKTQKVVRLTSSSLAMREYRRNVTVVDEAPNTATDWTRAYSSRDIIDTVSQVAGVPSGGLVQVAREPDPANNPFWEVERYAWGTQVLRMEVDLDASSTSAQIFNFPEDYIFVGGGKTFVSASYAITSPNEAIRPGNVSLTGYTTQVSVRLTTAGTQPGSPGNAEKMRLEITGRWFHPS